MKKTPDPGRGRNGTRTVATVVTAVFAVAALILAAILILGPGHKESADASNTATGASDTAASKTEDKATASVSPSAKGKTTAEPNRIWDGTRDMVASDVFQKMVVQGLGETAEQFGVTVKASAPDENTVRIDFNAPDTLRGRGKTLAEAFDANGDTFQELADSLAPLCPTDKPLRLNMRVVLKDGTVAWQDTWTAKE